VTTGSEAHCWGRNLGGQLGDGTTTDSPTPVRVVGGLRFRSVGLGSNHSCGVTTSHVAYCWGFNDVGQLGDGTEDIIRPTPVPVAGGLRFRQVISGGDGSATTCGVTMSHVAYCWGFNSHGQIGDGTGTNRLEPVPVAGGLAFRQVKPGSIHTCGVTTTHVAYCWGFNAFGELGDGTTIISVQPAPVLGELAFGVVDATGHHTCGVTTSHVAYCWGRNNFGQLGDGTTTDRLEPVPVATPAS
jgi:alpha-tubulin suppressor-like RCC1 family protein